MFRNPFPSGKNKLKWTTTQEKFICIVNFLEVLHAFKRFDDTNATANEIAATLMKVINVDVTTFDTKHIPVQPAGWQEDLVIKMIAVIEDDLRIEDALEGTGVLLPEAEQVRWLIRNFLTNEFVHELSRFVLLPK